MREQAIGGDVIITIKCGSKGAGDVSHGNFHGSKFTAMVFWPESGQLSDKYDEKLQAAR